MRERRRGGTSEDTHHASMVRMMLATCNAYKQYNTLLNLLFIFERLTKTPNMNIMYIGSNDYNYVYWKHSLQANMHNRIFGTFTRIRTSNMRIFTFSIFVPTYM